MPEKKTTPRTKKPPDPTATLKAALTRKLATGKSAAHRQAEYLLGMRFANETAALTEMTVRHDMLQSALIRSQASEAALSKRVPREREYTLDELREYLGLPSTVTFALRYNNHLLHGHGDDHTTPLGAGDRIVVQYPPHTPGSR